MWVEKGRQLGASDLHLETDVMPVARVRGELNPLGEALTAAQLDQLLKGLGGGLREQLAARGSADLSTCVAGVDCRVHVYRTSRGTALALRLLSAPGGLSTANLNPDLRRLVEARAGLVLVSGAPGSGKSTTLAALVQEINTSKARHILMLESPMEQRWVSQRAFISQREIPTHAPSFEQAILDARLENPDILVLSELRTPAVIRLALEAAGHGLVLAALNAGSCAEALSRICGVFPQADQGPIRAQLAESLIGVVCQRLEDLDSVPVRVPQCEVLWASTAARSAVREGTLDELARLLQSEEGMWSFERYRRWMEEKTDWVQPLPPPVAAEPALEQVLVEAPKVEPPTLAPAVPQPARGVPPRLPAAEVGPVRGPSPLRVAASSEGPGRAAVQDDEAIEISIDIDDEALDLPPRIKPAGRASR